MDISSIKDMTTEDLNTLMDEVSLEQQRRRSMIQIPAKMEALAVQYLEAEGAVPGDPWRQPVGAFDAYPLDWEVSHGDQVWMSLVASNVWEPGVSGWREVVVEGAVPAWVQPTGAHDAYKIGDKVEFEGSIYESALDSNTWSPTDYPAGWNKIS